MFPPPVFNPIFGTLSVGMRRSVDWASLLPPTSPLKLLYSLEIVNKIVGRGTDDKATDEAARTWCAAFLRHGGVAHLMKVGPVPASRLVSVSGVRALKSFCFRLVVLATFPHGTLLALHFFVFPLLHPVSKSRPLVLKSA